MDLSERAMASSRQAGRTGEDEGEEGGEGDRASDTVVVVVVVVVVVAVEEGHGSYDDSAALPYSIVQCSKLLVLYLGRGADGGRDFSKLPTNYCRVREHQAASLR